MKIGEHHYTEYLCSCGNNASMQGWITNPADLPRCQICKQLICNKCGPIKICPLCYSELPENTKELDYFKKRRNVALLVTVITWAFPLIIGLQNIFPHEHILLYILYCCIAPLLTLSLTLLGFLPMKLKFERSLKNFLQHPENHEMSPRIRYFLENP